MKIGVIGTGNIGATLIRQFRMLGHDVQMSNSRGPQSMASLALETGASPVNTEDMVIDADLLVIAIPLIGIQSLPKSLFKDCSYQTVVDATNYYPIRDGHLAELDAGEVESVWVSRQLERPVIKAFNSILAEALSDAACPKNSPNRIALPISGDDMNSKSVLAQLIDRIGFDPFDAGSLDQSWRQQPGAPAYCTNLSLKDLPNALDRANKALLPERRDKGFQKFMTAGNRPWRAVVEDNREMFC